MVLECQQYNKIITSHYFYLQFIYHLKPATSPLFQYQSSDSGYIAANRMVDTNNVAIQ